MKKSTRILYAEDSDMSTELIIHILKYKKYDVITADSAEDVIPLALAQNPDIIMMDVDLFGKSGIEVCNKIKNTPDLGNTSVFVVTNFPRDHVYNRMGGTSFDEYVSKPIDFNEFEQLIAKYTRSK